MFSWLTKLLNKPYTDVVAEVVPEYDPCVGEPVRAIVKSFKEKGRWKVAPNFDFWSLNPYKCSTTFSVEDTKTGERYTITSDSYIYCYGTFGRSPIVFPWKISKYGLPSWMTEGEKKFVVEELNAISASVKERLTLVEDRKCTRDQKQAKVNQEKERNRLMALYCKD